MRSWIQILSSERQSQGIRHRIEWAIMSLEEQIKQHKEISLQIEALEAQKKILSVEIMGAMTKKSMQFGSYVVRRCSRLSISSTVDQARPFQALKLAEVVDKEKLKELYKNGTFVPGIKEIEYIQVSLIEN